MKKLSIILLVVLVLLSVVSCKKDKSDDMIATYEEFVSAYNICSKTCSTLYSPTIGESVNVGNLTAVVSAITGADINVQTSVVKAGTKDVTTATDGTKTTKYNNFSIDYTYTEGEDKTVKNGTFTVNGTYDYLSPTVSTMSKFRAQRTFESVSYDLTINGKQYKLSYYKDGNNKYTSASVNGNDVELRLLNSRPIY